MALHKKFLRSTNLVLKIPKLRLFIGLTVGLGYAVTFYSFIYLCRELLRLFSVSDDYDLWVLTNEEVNFYNLFFSFIASIIGQSICFTFWWDRPKKLNTKRGYRRTSIINDQRVLNWIFLSWISRCALIFGILFGIRNKGYYTFSFYPDYIYLFLLIIIVLFLQMWTTIRLVYKDAALKWMLYSFLMITTFSFGLSRINLIDYEAHNKRYLEKNVFYNYQLALPESNLFDDLYETYLVKDIYIAQSRKGTMNLEPIIIVNGNKISLSQLGPFISDWQTGRQHLNHARMTCKFYIDRSITMDFVTKVKAELSKVHMYRIAYAIVPENAIYDQRYYQNYAILFRLPTRNDIDSTYLKKTYETVKKSPNLITIKQANTGEYTLNNSPIESYHLTTAFKTLISENGNYAVQFYINDKVSFDSYLKVISSFKEALSELRNEESKKEYGEDYEWLELDKKRKIAQKYPSIFFEWTKETLELCGEK